MARESADRIRAARNEPEFSLIVEFMRNQTLLHPKFVEGHVKGDTANLEFTGKNGDGNPALSNILMVREDGVWKVKEGSTSISMSD